MGESIGFIGLGAMGTPMALNILELVEGCSLHVFDVNEAAMAEAEKQGATPASSPKDIGDKCGIVVTMLPNDQILKTVCVHPETGLLSSPFDGIHISCSTVNPNTSRELSELHKEKGARYIGAPIFARADGVSQRQATIVVGGEAETIEEARHIMDAMAATVRVFGEDEGAGNVVKLCGNFMIAAAIESCAEACTLAEKNGLDRVAVMEMLSSTIFDCLIYRGYGMRIANRQHIPNQPLVGPGFQLELGRKDIGLVRDVSEEVMAPMPICSLLHDRFTTAQNLLCSKVDEKGNLDWSALGLLSSMEAGVDIQEYLPGGDKCAGSGESTAPM